MLCYTWSVETGQRQSGSRWLPYLYAVLLFGVNFAIARRLFFTEFTQHTSSNEGAFMAISRFLIERWPDVRWFPFWLNGVPFENTYFPLLQVTVAIVAKALHCSPALAYHAVTAFFYCLGPVCLFLFAWQASKWLHAAFLSGLLYSLWSPSLLLPAVRDDIGSWHHARRLQTLVHYGEGNHNTGLSLLPLALLCAWLAVSRRTFFWSVAAGTMLGAVILTNAFASVDLAIGFVILATLQPPGARVRSLFRLACIGGATYLWVSPILTPALVRTLRTNSPMVEGDYRYTPLVVCTGLLVLAGAASLWYFTRRWNNWFDRFAVLFAYVFVAVVALNYFARVAIMPQPWRYQLEMEMGLCLAIVFGARHALALAHPRMRTGALALFLAFLVWQAVWYRQYARGLIHSIDITRTIQYKTAKWIDANLKGLRTMVSGDAGFWFNVFTDNPQFSTAAEPFSPNWTVEIAAYTIYRGQNTLDRDAEYSILWLKAYGCHAITVPGPGSREGNHPFHNPGKFAGVLPLLWHDEDDSIYGVPARSKSLAHVIPADAAVRRPPANGLDVEGVARFVTAIENAALPLADFSWLSNTRARIATQLHPGQVVAVQVTYDPGWVATANGQPVQVTRDGIGLLTLHPQCDGRCQIELNFDGGPQRRICLGLSVLVMFGVAGAAGFFWIFKEVSKAPPTDSGLVSPMH
jgi:hypothetical protein